MATWTYTKKIIMSNITPEGRAAHQAAFFDQGSYYDWYHDQVDAGLADESSSFLLRKLISGTVYEFLVTDQAQADSYIALAMSMAAKLGHPKTAEVFDVNYTTDTIPSDFETY